MIMTIYFGRQFGTTEPRGSIWLDPEIWLPQKGTLGNFRKILKLSAESDRYFDTMTLPIWKETIEEIYYIASANEKTALSGVKQDYQLRLRKAEDWRKEHLQKEDERFRKAKVHRGKSHAERMNEIEGKYMKMRADVKKRYDRELESTHKQTVRAKELAAAQLEEIRKLMQEENNK